MFHIPPKSQMFTNDSLFYQLKLQAQEKRANDLEKDVERLIAQLKDLTNLKKEHEDAMLVKFQELLNSKKQHIRELTRLVDVKGRQNSAIGLLYIAISTFLPSSL